MSRRTGIVDIMRQMKKILRHFLINLLALWVATRVIPGLTYSGGIKTLLLGTLIFMVINWALLPLLKVLFLPINILTVGFFGWAVNVVGFYVLTVVFPQFKLLPFVFPGANLAGIAIPSLSLNLLEVAIASSLVVGLISHFLQWLVRE
jgi:putative membrane protein